MRPSKLHCPGVHAIRWTRSSKPLSVRHNRPYINN
jgi:hypothetical protein